MASQKNEAPKSFVGMSTTIVCLRVKSKCQPPSNSTFRKCDVCGENIWLALNSPSHIDHLICDVCFNETEKWDELIFHNPT